MMINKQDSDDDVLRQFELFDEIDTCVAQENGMTKSSSRDGLDWTNHSSVSVFSAFSVTSNASKGDPLTPQNGMTKSMSRDALDWTNHSSVSVFSVFSVASNASTKAPGDPRLAEQFIKIACARNASPTALTKADLDSTAEVDVRSAVTRGVFARVMARARNAARRYASCVARTGNMTGTRGGLEPGSFARVEK